MRHLFYNEIFKILYLSFLLNKIKNKFFTKDNRKVIYLINLIWHKPILSNNFQYTSRFNVVISNIDKQLFARKNHKM